MTRVILTVYRVGDSHERDLEVPADVELGILVDLIARALDWDAPGAAMSTAYEVEAQPLGRPLRPRETLADAGVWDGSRLVFHRPGEAVKAIAADGPARGWRPLDLSAPVEHDLGTSEAPPAGPAYRWKRVDQD